MNWKKVLVFTFGGALAGSLGHWATEVQAGHQFAFTFGNIGIPALVTAASTILALFTKQPQQPTQ